MEPFSASGLAGPASLSDWELTLAGLSEERPAPGWLMFSGVLIFIVSKPDVGVVFRIGLSALLM